MLQRSVLTVNFEQLLLQTQLSDHLFDDFILLDFAGDGHRIFFNETIVGWYFIMGDIVTTELSDLILGQTIWLFWNN